MKRNEAAIITALIALGFVGFGGLASAASLSFSTSFGSAGSPLPASSFPQTLSLTKFDSSLGTLTSVTLKLDSTANVTPFVVNNNATPVEVYKVTGTYTMDLLGPDNSEISFDLKAGPYGTVSSKITVPGSQTQYDLTTSTESASATSPATDFTAYQGIGSDTFNVDVDASNSAGGSNPGYNYVAYGVNGYIYGTVEVTYEYTPIPEPVAYGLLAGLGLLGFGAYRRFRKV